MGLIVVMGVCASGKSTIALSIKERLESNKTDLNSDHKYYFIEGDDFHSKESKIKMANGTPLSDHDRVPWLESLCTKIKSLHALNGIFYPTISLSLVLFSVPIY
jgi:gluconokinase